MRSVTIKLSSFNLAFISYADSINKKSVSDFIDAACDVIQEFDTDNENNDFLSCRLIVKATGSFDTFSTKENVKGFENIHILQ